MFNNRYDAANQMRASLQKYKNSPDVVVVAIPRGALEIGAVLAKELNAPLDVAFVKKIGAPGNPEFAIGAASMLTKTVDPAYQDLTDHIQQETRRIRDLLAKRQQNYYTKDIGPIDLVDKIVILTDDGIATGRTFLEAIKLVKLQKPRKIIVAVPVADPGTLAIIRPEVDEIACTHQPKYLAAISQYYREFPQVEDEEAIRLLHTARGEL